MNNHAIISQNNTDVEVSSDSITPTPGGSTQQESPPDVTQTSSQSEHTPLRRDSQPTDAENSAMNPLPGGSTQQDSSQITPAGDSRTTQEGSTQQDSSVMTSGGDGGHHRFGRRGMKRKDSPDQTRSRPAKKSSLFSLNPFCIPITYLNPEPKQTS